MRLLRWVIATGLLFSAPTLFPQSPATLTFHFEDKRQQPAAYTITLHEDGSGQFHAVAGPTNPDDIAALPGEGQDRSIQIMPATAQHFFEIARAKKFFAGGCEDAGPTIAFTGRKTLNYQGQNGQGECTFNHSKDQKIQWLTVQMQGIAQTLEEGRRLELEHAHGRLTLDAELETLEGLVRNGHAVELGTIAPTLLSIAQDPAVMQRAQMRARRLLAIADAGGIVTK